MNKSWVILIFMVGLCCCTSCKSVHKITDKDNSSAAKNIRKKNKRSVKFIDGIEVTPGSVVKSKHKPATTKGGNSEIGIPADIPTTSKINIEKTNPLIIKYAILLNTYIENLKSYALYQRIDEWMGTAYCIGGTTKQCVDCSAFTGIMMRDVFNINLPRTASEQFTMATHIEREALQEGDLVFFRTHKSNINHVGIYLHNNKFVHASTSNGVMISDLNETYWKHKYASGGRVIDK